MHILQFANMYNDNKIFYIIMRTSYFFMPWFYFKSGYFYKAPNFVSFEIISEKARKLLIPFFVFFIIGFAMNFPFEIYMSERPVLRMILTPFYQLLEFGGGGLNNQPLWFLLSLFFANIFYIIIDKYNFNLIIIFFPIIGFLLDYYKINLPLGLSKLFLGVFFFGAGNYFKLIERNQNIFTNIIMFTVYVIYVVFLYSYLDFRSNTIIIGNYFIYTIGSLVGIVFFIWTGNFVFKINLLNYIGVNSLIYFIVHWIILVFVRNIFCVFNLKTTNFIFAIILTLSVFIIMPLIVTALKGKFKFLIGG